MPLSSSTCSVVAALAIVVLAMQAHWRDRDTSTFALGCDPFGYERMARVFREARAAGSAPDFFLHDEQTRWLVGKFKENQVPPPVWGEAVTTHAHHYFPGSDQVGPQYPPGTGWVLSLFPAPNDVKALDRLTIAFVAAGGLGFAAWCAWRGLAASSLVLAGAVATALSPYGWIQGSSYSINATILPLCAGTTLAWIACRARNRSAAMALGFGAGCLFGLLIQIRLASALLAPAAGLLFVPRRFRLLPPYAAGVVLAGVLPVLIHNRVITGQLLGATYSAVDRSQGFGSVADNVRFYFGSHVLESGCLHVLGLVAALALWLAATAATRPRGALPAWREWLATHYGVVAAPVCAAGLSVAYFLTHTIVILYYLTPAMLLTGLLLGLLFVSLETHWLEMTGGFAAAGTFRAGLAVAAAGAPALAGLRGPGAVGHRVRAVRQTYDDPPQILAVPAELLAPQSWVWADLYSSSILYYTGHPSFKALFAPSPTRLAMYRWVQAKGDPQYLVVDSNGAESQADEARAAGWRLTPVGEIRGATCYKMEAPREAPTGSAPDAKPAA